MGEDRAEERSRKDKDRSKDKDREKDKDKSRDKKDHKDKERDREHKDHHHKDKDRDREHKDREKDRKKDRDEPKEEVKMPDAGGGETAIPSVDDIGVKVNDSGGDMSMDIDNTNKCVPGPTQIVPGVRLLGVLCGAHCAW
eukprot:1805542-Pyramimonas_sp.AAC.1